MLLYIGSLPQDFGGGWLRVLAEFVFVSFLIFFIVFLGSSYI